MKKMTNRQLQAIQTKKKILQAAYDLMLKRGVESITMEDICQNADVSVGAVYHYFKSKNDILFDLYARVDRYFEETATTSPREGDALARLQDFFHRYALYMESSGVDFSRHVYHTSNVFLADESRYIQALLREIIRDGQAQGSLSGEESAEAIREALLIIAHGVIFHWCLRGGSYSLTVKVDTFISYTIAMFTR